MNPGSDTITWSKPQYFHNQFKMTMQPYLSLCLWRIKKRRLSKNKRKRSQRNVLRKQLKILDSYLEFSKKMYNMKTLPVVGLNLQCLVFVLFLKVYSVLREYNFSKCLQFFNCTFCSIIISVGKRVSFSSQFNIQLPHLHLPNKHTNWKYAYSSVFASPTPTQSQNTLLST